MKRVRDLWDKLRNLDDYEEGILGIGAISVTGVSLCFTLFYIPKGVDMPGSGSPWPLITAAGVFVLGMSGVIAWVLQLRRLR